MIQVHGSPRQIAQRISLRTEPARFLEGLIDAILSVFLPGNSSSVFSKARKIGTKDAATGYGRTGVDRIARFDTMSLTSGRKAGCEAI